MAEVIVGIKQEPIEAETVELVDVDYENQEKTDENIPQKRKRGRPLKTTKLLTEDEAETAAQVESLFPTGRPKRNVTPRVNSDYVYSSLGRAASPSKDQDKSNKKPVDNVGKRKLKMEDLTALATTADEDGNEVLYEIHISDLEQMQMVQDGQTILEVVDPEKAQEVFVGASVEEVGEPSSNALHSTENEEAYADVEMKQEPQLQDDDDQDYPHGYQPTNEKKRKKVYMKDPSDPMRRFTCPYVGCSYVAKYRSNLWDHKKTHTGEKPYHCTWPDCEMRFSQTHQLKLHLRSHTGERPYKCTWPGCDASFSQKPGLRSHVLTHTGEKDFKCDFPGCNWSFRLKGALTDHKRAVHENAKKFLCEWPGCGKRFLQSCHLKKHLMAHADIKPFACDWPKCTYKAVTMAYVTNHRRTHTGERNHECPFPGCHKRFVKSSHLNRHRQRCHAGIVRLNQDGEYVDDEEIYQDEENEEVFEEREEVQELGDSNEILIEFSDQVDDIIVSVNGTKRIIKGQLVEDKDGSQYIATIDPETGESITTPMEDILQLKSEPVVSYEDIEIKTEVQ